MPLLIFSKWLFVVSLWLFVAPVYGQVMLELSPQGIQVDNRNFYIHEVVDTRLDQSRIGFIPKGGKYNFKIAMFPTGLSGYLNKYLRQSLPPSPLMHAVLLRIDRFGILSERIKKNVARLHAHFTFYAVSDSGYQEVFSKQYHADSQEFLGESKHEDLIRFALTESISEMAISGWEQKLHSIPFNSYVDITERTIPPILVVEKPKVGVYRSFEEFRNNTPYFTNFHWKGSSKWNREPYYLDENGKVKNVPGEDELWGFSDGEKLYLIEEKNYVELHRSSRDVHYRGTNRTKKGKNALKWGVGGGVIAGGIAMGATNHSGLYIIDMETGVHLYAR
jgi:hypothetical protein